MDKTRATNPQNNILYKNWHPEFSLVVIKIPEEKI
jgi:hypothetical protein